MKFCIITLLSSPAFFLHIPFTHTHTHRAGD